MNEGQVVVEVESIINDLPEIDYKQVLYEAITNSIQANADEIKVKFIYNTLNFEDVKKEEKVLEAIEIIDNGEGFIDKNVKAFKEYKTKNKINLGCKGVGRFLFLKLFERVEIESLDKKIEFVVNKDIEAITQNKMIKKTIVKLLKPKNKIVVNFENLQEKLKEHFIAYFKLLQDEGRVVKISIFENDNLIFEIKSNEIPNFNSIKFKIKNHDFILSYVFNDKNLPNEGYYCAGKRVVKKNSELENNKKLKLYKQFNILFLLESKYLDENVKSDTRDDFTIYPKRRNDDLFSNISWEDIKNELKIQIQNIAKANGIDIEKIAKENIEKAINKAPYLGFYINENDDFLDSEELINNAKKRLEEDKIILRTNRDKIDKADFYKKLSIVTQTELAEYIFDREKVIERLKSLTDEKSLEKEIHDLFMKRKTMDDKQDYRRNHLWLFDDRFMTYDKVFSDKQIKEIFPKLSENLDRPDLLSIISNTYEKNKMTDIVVIELKRPDEKITPAGAEEQLLDYASYINENFEDENRKIRIWTYAFLKFDKATERRLISKGYNRVFTNTEYPLYYRPYPNENTIINFIDYKTLAYDAELRNKTFLKILKGEQFKEG